MIPDEATRRQIEAADPLVSTWLSANAGSGKTRVLTDRVARLLLDGVSPQNILCLTYTKAAASEMQNRLFKRLGKWSMRADDGLRDDLKQLGVPEPGDAGRLANARTLFARAIETPGGLRIQTIHSFCASLLRRFPLEAGVSPVFREMEDRSAKLLRQEIVEEMADGPDVAVVKEVARHYTGEDFGKLTAEIVRHRGDLPKNPTAQSVWQQFDLTPGYSETDLLNKVFQTGDGALIDQLVETLRSSAKITDQKAAEKLRQVNLTRPGNQGWNLLFSVFLTGSGAKIPYAAKIGGFPTKDLRSAHPDLIQSVDEFMARAEAGRSAFISLYSAEKTLALYNFSEKFLPEYERRKAQAGWLDFDDLISRARLLLTDPAVAQWVLFRLDGGLDHILVDEAQDTSPEQWRIVELLAQEFSSGAGARSDIRRTIFVVGDIKQSIYSFQGADPREFDRMQHHFADSLGAVDQRLNERTLDHSFRSSSAILTLVDATFDGVPGPGFTGSQHMAFHGELPGRVDLWPVVPKPEEPEQKEWYDPTDKLAANDHRIMLAGAIADQIQQMVDSETITGENDKQRRVGYGDFLILVQRRSDLFHEIIRACKTRELPIAGADRLKIGAELAVRDLTALLSFLTTPEDDLSLAAVLRSPLFGFSESDLYRLAHLRHERRLWPALARCSSDHTIAYETLFSLRNLADFLGPFELLERILTRFDGRRLLLARLGAEAEDGIDAMLSQAIEYERSETPSLTGFLTWLEVDAVEIKRQSDSAGDRIRVMTTHGAKGLESPIVILPDTGDIRPRQVDEIVLTESGLPIWKPRTDFQTNSVKQALTTQKLAQAEERQRLLYVALTRAEKWLIICASGDVKAVGDSWYRQVEAGMKAVGSVTHDQPTGEGLRFQHGDWAPARLEEQTEPVAADKALPGWATTPARHPSERATVLSPSKLGGTKILPGEVTDDLREDGARRGRQLHLLFEYLPGREKPDWSNLANQLLGFGEDAATPDEISNLLAEAGSVMNNSELTFLFEPGALTEVNVSADVAELGGKRVSGTIDRLIVSSDHVLIVDYKSNQQVPASPGDTPDGLLRQMGAYLSIVENIYPDRSVEVAILWTQTADLMILPHDIVREALKASLHLDEPSTFS